jgi:arylsulfatase A-like enzyme
MLLCSGSDILTWGTTLNINVMSKLTKTGFCLLFVIPVFVLQACNKNSGNEKPNIIIIFVDDLGYGDLSCYGAAKLHTPNIDRLAAEGRMFTDAHTVSAVCTPSRYALLTGEYPFRAKGGKGVWGPLRRDNKLIIDTARLTIAKVMKSQGYATACLGKWHLGFGEESPTNWNERLIPGPLQLGFDYYFGVPLVNSGPPFVYVENEHVVGLDPEDPLVKDGNPVTATQLYPDKSPNTYAGGVNAHALYKDDEIGTTLAAKAAKWIEDNKDNPFFLYLATTNIHHPFSPHTRFKGTSQSGRYGDFVHELDWMVGEVINALEEAQLTSNTLIIFTSDNGGMLNQGGQEAWQMGHRMNGDLLGFKFDAWEGGHRVPFVARWPGKIEPGTKSTQLLANIDLLATVAAITGYQLEEEDAPDSYNMLPALTGDPGNPIRDYLVIAPFRKENLSLRKGKWMYIGARGGGGWNGGNPGDHILGGPAALKFTGEKNSDVADGEFIEGAPAVQLYDLEADLSQAINLAGEKPEVVSEMEETLNAIIHSKMTREAKIIK